MPPLILSDHSISSLSYYYSHLTKKPRTQRNSEEKLKPITEAFPQTPCCNAPSGLLADLCWLPLLSLQLIMPTMLSKSLPLSTNFTMDEEAKASEQGIVSILGCDCQKSNKTASLRRTLSADMSSQKWLSQYGSIADSSSSSSSSSNDEEEEESAPKPSNLVSWGSILNQKGEEGLKSPPPPYVHPLMKRSSSTLSEKSLEICTESLGSETGSDGFSSSEDGDAEDQQERRRSTVIKKSYLASKKSSRPRSFPPPLPSLSREDGTSVSMRSRRDNGRLVVDAVTVSNQNNFQAHRHGGRLILTLVNHEEAEEETKEEENRSIMELDEESIVFDGIDGGKEVDDAVEFVMDEAPKIINVQKLALLMNKSMVMPNRNPAWLNKKFNEVAKYQEEEGQWPNSVPLQNSVGTNAYDYFWRTKTTTTFETVNSISQPPSSLKSYSNNCFIPVNSVPNEIIQDYSKAAAFNGSSKRAFNLAPLMKSCNEPRKSLLFWGQDCIATS